MITFAQAGYRLRDRSRIVSEQMCHKVVEHCNFKFLEDQLTLYQPGKGVQIMTTTLLLSHLDFQTFLGP